MRPTRGNVKNFLTLKRTLDARSHLTRHECKVPNPSYCCKVQRGLNVDKGVDEPQSYRSIGAVAAVSPALRDESSSRLAKVAE